LNTENPTSLYIHIPFCKSRCFYCDFNTFVAPPEAMAAYVTDLKKEITMLAAQTTQPLQTVFFGGGTPTALSSAQLAEVLEHLWSVFAVAPDIEVTMEANPGSATPEKLRVMRGHGVNRLSFGAQTFNPRLLMAIGRIHDTDDIQKSIFRAQESGFERINIDLMFGLPEQTPEDVEDALTATQKLGVDHVSAYWLKVEEGTPFGTWAAAGRLPLPGEDAEADMYDMVYQTLQAHGYQHYEISNFAKPGAEARHNLVYWRNQPYLAAGAGAHGYVAGVRYENVRRLDDYARRIGENVRPIAAEETVTERHAMENTMMLGLRLAEGVSKTTFVQRHGVTVESVFGATMDRLVKQQLLDVQADRIRIPHRVWPLGNVVFEQFLD